VSDTESTGKFEGALVPAVGAVLFASDEPVQPKEIAKAFKGVEVAEVVDAIETLQTEYEKVGSGLHVEKVAGGFRVATRPEVGAYVRQFFRQRNRTRLSPAALETLAIVAYKQPVTSPEIQAIRGKDPAGALKGLLDKKLVRIVGKKKVVGRPLLYGTAREFLIHFGLDSLEDLPTITEFEHFAEALDSAVRSAAGEPLKQEEESPEAVEDDGEAQ
jgi:segregation and condensation protein B